MRAIAVASLLGLAGLVAPPTADAQPANVARIGIIAATPLPSPQVNALLQGLRELGYVDGRNVVIEQRSAGGQSERFPELIAEAIRLKVNVLVVGSTPGVLAAKRATTTIPIVFAGVPDPVAQGIVPSLARPGGNITGVSMAIGEGFAGKWVELLKEAVPSVSHLAVLRNSTNPASAIFLKEVHAAARIVNVRLEVVDARDLAQLERAFATIAASRAGGLIVTADPLFATNASAIVQFAAGKQLPAMYFFGIFAHSGGLIAYGPSVADGYRRAASYVDRILKGARPADLPVEQNSKFELVVNLRTAKALSLTIPASVLLRADEVIE